MHFSHFNTWKTAQKILLEKVFLGICQSDLKTEGLFSLKERAEIVEKYYNFPTDQIILLHSKEEIIKVIKNSEKIIRGIRYPQDLKYIEKLTRYYISSEIIESQKSKLLKISVPEEMKVISSTQLIDFIKRNLYDPNWNWIPESLIPLIQKKIKQKNF